MSKILFFLLLCFFLLSGCHKEIDNSYVKCQSFDEFSMKEIFTDSILSPYLLVQRQEDTIRIIASTNLKDTMTYLNKGSYWYSSVRIDLLYNWWSKICNRFRPVVFGHDITRMDVFRYIYNDTIIDVYLEEGTYPYYILVCDRQKSTQMYIDEDLSNYIDTAKLRNTFFMHIYQEFDHYDRGGRHSVNNYEYDSVSNVLYESWESFDGEIFVDTIQLNSLKRYHVPTYDFATVDGNYVYGIFNDKMKIRMQCTTIETDKYTTVFP